MEENLNEGRTQIKRQYGQYSKIKVNEKAPIRNKVIGFVGKRFVTEEEMLKEHNYTFETLSISERQIYNNAVKSCRI